MDAFDWLGPTLLAHGTDSEFAEWAVKTYTGAIRSSMFTGFLTLSGFLLSATTFIIIQMKKEVYEQPEYRERCIVQRKYDEKHRVYKPLRNLSRVLMVAIVLSLVASASQVTIGLHESFAAVVTCYAIALIAIVGVGVVLGLMAWNLRIWFNDLDDQAEKEIKKTLADREDAASRTAAPPDPPAAPLNPDAASQA